MDMGYSLGIMTLGTYYRWSLHDIMTVLNATEFTC